MMGKISFVKLADKFVLPLVLLIAARYLGVFIVGLWLPISFSMGAVSDIFSLPFLNFAGPTGLFLANSFSWALIAVLLGLYFGFVLYRSIHLHEDFLHPKQAWHIHNKKLESLTINSRESLHQIVVWLVISFAAVFLALGDLLSKNLSPLVFSGLASVATLLVMVSVLILMGKDLEGRKVK
jgi:hypothetical protein